VAIADGREQAVAGGEQDRADRQEYRTPCSSASGPRTAKEGEHDARRNEKNDASEAQADRVRLEVEPQVEASDCKAP